MTPQDALAELLARVGANDGAPVLISDDELSDWPMSAVGALKSQKLLVRAHPARTAVCPGCELACMMPVHSVHSMPRAGSAAIAFVVCDKRADINRVQIPAARLSQWRCDGEAVCAFVAACLRLRRSGPQRNAAGLLSIGITSGAKRSQMLCLRASEEVGLVAGVNSLPLPDVIAFGDGKYAIDHGAIRNLVDSATTADPRYTPSIARRESRKLDTLAMHRGWQKAYRDFKKARPGMSDVWYSRQIAKMPAANGRGPETIRKHMK